MLSGSIIPANGRSARLTTLLGDPFRRVGRKTRLRSLARARRPHRSTLRRLDWARRALAPPPHSGSNSYDPARWISSDTLLLLMRKDFRRALTSFVSLSVL